MTEAAADVLHEKRDRAFWITINRPDKRNAINADVIAGIRAGYREAHADPQVRAIVLTAAGEKAFCAGGDLQPGKGFAFDLSRPNIDYADLMREAQNEGEALRSEEHTSELQSLAYLVCRLLLEKKKNTTQPSEILTQCTEITCVRL